MDAPRYSYPPGVLAALVRDLVLLRRRDFQKDARACVEWIRPPLHVIGRVNIPQHGPCVVTVNHYHRPGFGAQWFSLSIASLVPVRMHWIMTGEFTYPGTWYERLGASGSKFLLQRIAYVYGFSTMPPMPPREKDVKPRAASVRAVLEYVKRAERPVLGLAPEGYDPPAGTLTRPAPGLGRFGLLLSRAGLQFCPVGVYEMDGCFHVHFGEAYRLSVPPGLSPDEKDHQASQIIMENIARLLPVHLRGEFN
ncbi:MAG: hypothetical protein ACM3PS_04410 [Syntrophothermus sp.]